MKRMQVIALLLSVVGCTNIGPKTIPRDRFDYNLAIADSWKEQTLLNIVKIRYADMPLFVEVASIVSGYTLEGSVNLGGTLSSPDTVQGDFLSMGASGKYTDRPTITYAPLTGSRFSKSFMTPLPPKAVMFMMQTGWPADLVFPMTVDSINGLRSQIAAGTNQREGDLDFYRVISLLRKIQQSGAVGMRIVKDEDEKESTVMFFYKELLTPKIQEALHEVRRLLGLGSDTSESTVTYGLLPSHDRELAMITRSMLQIMIELATRIDVPEEHVAEGRTLPSLAPPEEGVQAAIRKQFTVKCCAKRPHDAHVAVKYKNHWYWIDDRDFISKRTFAFLMILFSLTETGGKEGLPLVTIPAS